MIKLGECKGKAFFFALLFPFPLRGGKGAPQARKSVNENLVFDGSVNGGLTIGNQNNRHPFCGPPRSIGKIEPM